MEDNILMKHNKLVKAQQDINLYENKLFIYLIYRFQKIKDESITTIQISRKDLGDLISTSKTHRTHKFISQSLENLEEEKLKLKEKNKDGTYKWHNYRFISGSTYDESTDTYTIESSKELHKLLYNYLKEGYTPVNLSIWLSLRSTYSQRFYDFLRLWSNTQDEVTYPIEELRELLMLDDKYKSFTELNRRVIQPSVNELNKTGFFEIIPKSNKIGRNIESITFEVKDLDKRKYFAKKENINVIESEECGNNKEFDTTDALNKENNTNTPSVVEETLKIENKDYFIPDEYIFTKGTLRSFKKDFASIDFKNEYMEKAFDDAVMITLDRDDVETIKATSYKFFKSTLENKITEYKLEEQEDLKHNADMDMNW